MLGYTTDEMGDATTAAQELGVELVTLGKHGAPTVDTIANASTAVNDLTEAGKGAGPAMDDLRDALDDAAEAGRGLEEHLKGVRDILDELDKSDAALDLADQMDDTKKAMEEAFYAGATGAEDFEQKQRDAQREVNQLKRDVIEYGDSIGGIPAEKLTEINALIDAGSIEEAKRELDRLTMARTVQLYLSALPNAPSYGGGGSPQQPGTGGAVPNPAPGKHSLADGRSGGSVVQNIYLPPGSPREIVDLITQAKNDGLTASWMAK
jgi:ABC-type transporter Mla subunit MlaD